MFIICFKHTHTHTHTQPFYGSLDFVQVNPDEPVPEEAFTHSHQSLSTLRAWRSFSTISLQVFFGQHLGLAPSTSLYIFSYWQRAQWLYRCTHTDSLTAHLSCRRRLSSTVHTPLCSSPRELSMWACATSDSHSSCRGSFCGAFI